MESLDDLLAMAETAHGHLCAGQILGVRMALFGLERLGIEDPRGADRKRLVTYVEIDRCATDAIGLVTGCRLGKRALKFRDWGKMAATFVDLPSGRGVRIVGPPALPAYRVERAAADAGLPRVGQRATLHRAMGARPRRSGRTTRL
jgi:formylmethanofuran dehydrogenase subunit E